MVDAPSLAQRFRAVLRRDEAAYLESNPDEKRVETRGTTGIELNEGTAKEWRYESVAVMRAR